MSQTFSNSVGVLAGGAPRPALPSTLNMDLSPSNHHDELVSTTSFDALRPKYYLPTETSLSLDGILSDPESTPEHRLYAEALMKEWR